MQEVLKPRLRHLITFRVSGVPDMEMEALTASQLAQLDPILLDFLQRPEATGLWARYSSASAAGGHGARDLTTRRDTVMQISEAAKLSRTVLEALQQVIVGKEQVLQHLLLGLYSGGNILIEDFPGLAKTLTARLLAQVTGLDFKRIQFTPDLLPGRYHWRDSFTIRNWESLSFVPARCLPTWCSPMR